MVLDTENKSLEALLDNTGTDVIFTVDFQDQVSNMEQPTRKGSQITASNGTSDVAICAAPVVGVTRDITYINVYNGNAATRVFTLQIDDGGTERIQVTISLATTESAVWTPESSWNITT